METAALWVVSIAVGGLAPEGAEAGVVTACRDALGQAACVGESGAAPPDDMPRWRASVTFEPEAVRIALEPTAPRAKPPHERSLDFAPSETDAKRVRAAGLLVAALAASLEPPEPPAPLRGTVSGHLVELQLRSRGPGLLWFELGGLVASGWGGSVEGGSWGGGGELRAGFAPGGGPLWVGASGRLVFSPLDEAEGRAGTAGFGLGWRARGGAWSWALGLEAVAQRLDVTLDADSRAASRGGGRVLARASWGRGWLAPYVGLDAAFWGPVVELRREERLWLVVPPWEVGLSLGLRFRVLGEP